MLDISATGDRPISEMWDHYEAVRHLKLADVLGGYQA